jgi:hypothetical protein
MEIKNNMTKKLVVVRTKILCFVFTLAFLILSSCPPKFYDYLVATKEKDTKIDSIWISVEGGRILTEVFGKYLPSPDHILTTIGVRITNNTADTIVFNSQGVSLNSVNFHYEKSFTFYSYKISPGKQEPAGFDFETNAQLDFVEGEVPRLPEDEKIFVKINGIYYKGTQLEVMEIPFIPVIPG